MTAADRTLDTLRFPAQYLDVGEALTRVFGGDVAAYYRHCGAAYPPDLTVSLTGSQIRRSNEWMLALCPPGKPPLVSFIEHFPVTSHGALGMLAITARTLGEALDGALRYFPLVMPAYALRRQDVRDRVHLLFEPLCDAGPVRDFFTETVVTALLRIAPFVAREPDPMPVIHFTHAPLGAPEAYEAAFGCRFVFGSPFNGIVLDRALLAIPLLTPSPSSHQMLRATLEQESRRQTGATPVTQAVRRQLQQALRDQTVLEAPELASRLAMSPRTLSRRLREEGATLPQLRSEVGCEYADTLLLETDRPVAWIAGKAGFRDAAAFTRAFRRWRGVTPTERRAGRSSPDA